MLKALDLTETVAFYTKTLGFHVENQRNSEDGKPTWCALRWDGAALMFYSAESLDQPPGVPSMTGVLYFNPMNVRALWERLKGSVKVEWPLEQMDYGMLEFAIRDCNGYILSFGQENDG
jgi:uncharacterized glyoxalase superfamily protein PhnB